MQSATLPPSPKPLHKEASSVTPRLASRSDAAVTERLYFLDNLRVALMIVVIVHHVGQAYGPTGGWWPIQEAARAAVLEPFFTVNRSFGMSLFFMIAGYFTAKAYDAKGPRALLRSRFLRLGLPLLGYVLVMIPLQLFVFVPPAGQSPSVWPIEVGHMWFVEHLLIFSTGYALVRAIRRGNAESVQDRVDPPGYLPIVIFALALAIVSAVVRIWYPIDKLVYLLGFVRVAFADVPRDLSFFIIGAIAYRHDWLNSFPTRAGKVWLVVGTLAAGLWYAYALGLRDVLPGSDAVVTVLYPFWEMLLCCGMCIGLVILFREKFRFQG